MTEKLKALPCLCGGNLDRKSYQAFSVDSSFDYVGCDKCDLGFVYTDEIDEAVIRHWNKFMGGRAREGSDG